MQIETSYSWHRSQAGSGLVPVLLGIFAVVMFTAQFMQRITNLELAILRSAGNDYRELQNYIETRLDLVATIGMLSQYYGVRYSVGQQIALCPKADPAVINTSTSAGYTATSGDYRCATVSLQMVTQNVGGTNLTVDGKTYTVRATYAGKKMVSDVTYYDLKVEALKGSTWETAFITTLPKERCDTPIAGVPCVEP